MVKKKYHSKHRKEKLKKTNRKMKAQQKNSSNKPKKSTKKSTKIIETVLVDLILLYSPREEQCLNFSALCKMLYPI